MVGPNMVNFYYVWLNRPWAEIWSHTTQLYLKVDRMEQLIYTIHTDIDGSVQEGVKLVPGTLALLSTRLWVVHMKTP